MKRIVSATTMAFAVITVCSIVQAQPPTLVETSVVKTMEFHDQITLVGKTQALSNSRIVAEVSGRVTGIAATEGNPIERGALLVSIDSRRISLSLEAKRAQVAQAKAVAELAEKELARTRDLRSRDLASEGGLDVDIAENTRSVELYNQLLAEQKQLELDFNNCSVRSPFKGYTVQQLVDVGEWVNPGTPVYEVVDLSTIKVVVDLPERHYGHVTIGSEVAIHISGSPHTAVGKVTGFAPNASGDTHTFPVIIVINNENGLLGGGMLVRATVSLKEVFTSMAVHKDAVIRQGLQTMVYTIADGKAAPVPVLLGSTSGDMIAVSGDGVTDGMIVVVRGNERIFPGSPVRTAQDQAPPQPAAGTNAGADGDQGTNSDGDQSARKQ